MSSPTPYDRARALLQSGTSRNDAVQKLIDEGVDRETASLAVASLAGKTPLPIDDFGDVDLAVGMTGMAPTLGLTWRGDTVMDAQLNLVFGTIVAATGVLTAILHASGQRYTFLLFALVLLALTRVNLRDLWGSMFRLVASGVVVTWAVLRGSEGYFVAAAVTLAAGAFYAVRGLLVLQRLQAKVTPPSPGPQAPAQAPAVEPVLPPQ